jgi:hypothetical protein
MNHAVPQLRQTDAVTCGPSVALMAGVLMDRHRRAALTEQALFAAAQVRLHAELNRLWPRRLGTTPWAMARAISAQGSTAGVPYRWRLFRGQRDSLADVTSAVADGRPVAMLVGRIIPRHWVLIVDAAGQTLSCYEPSSGDVRTVDLDAIRGARLTGLGYLRPFAFVLPYSNV